jgi:hypothetical protein
MTRTIAGFVRLAVFSAAVCAAATQTEAAMIFIDFEAFNDFDNLNGVNLGGVTLTSPNGQVEVYDARFGVSFHSATKAIASPIACCSVNPLIGVFDCPVTHVSLWGGDAATCPDELDCWELLAFDAPSGGNLVGSTSSGTWVGSPYRQLAITAEEIWRFEAYWTGACSGVGYDDLQFEIVPEPGSGVLFAMSAVGLTAFARLRRRR